MTENRNKQDVDEESEESFPASDPPSHNPGTADDIDPEKLKKNVNKEKSDT